MTQLAYAPSTYVTQTAPDAAQMTQEALKATQAVLQQSPTPPRWSSVLNRAASASGIPATVIAALVEPIFVRASDGTLKVFAEARS